MKIHLKKTYLIISTHFWCESKIENDDDGTARTTATPMNKLEKIITRNLFPRFNITVWKIYATHLTQFEHNHTTIYPLERTWNETSNENPPPTNGYSQFMFSFCCAFFSFSVIIIAHETRFRPIASCVVFSLFFLGVFHTIEVWDLWKFHLHQWKIISILKLHAPLNSTQTHTQRDQFEQNATSRYGTTFWLID